MRWASSPDWSESSLSLMLLALEEEELELARLDDDETETETSDCLSSVVVVETVVVDVDVVAVVRSVVSSAALLRLVLFRGGREVGRNPTVTGFCGVLNLQNHPKSHVCGNGSVNPS